MTKKPQQLELEELIKNSADKDFRPTLIDPFLGVEFKGKARNHYEFNDGVPVAPAVEIPRPTIRQRIEHLTSKNPEVLQQYLYGLRRDVPDESLDLDIPDDPEAPLTDSEANYIDHVAGALAEQAPVPDDGMPRPEAPPPPQPSPEASPKAPVPPEGGAPAPTSAPPKGAGA